MRRKPDDETARALARVNRLAWWLDQSVRVPVIGRRIGADAILGLIPVLGDALGGLASIYIVAVAARMGVPNRVLLRMGANVLVDTLLGSVPIAGDLFDMGFKANMRNARLLARHAAVPGAPETTMASPEPDL